MATESFKVGDKVQIKGRGGDKDKTGTVYDYLRYVPAGGDIDIYVVKLDGGGSWVCTPSQVSSLPAK